MAEWPERLKMEESKEEIVAREAMLRRKEELRERKERARLERFVDDVDEAIIGSSEGDKDAAARLAKIGDDIFAQCLKARGECYRCSWRERCRSRVANGKTVESIIPKEKLCALRDLTRKVDAVECFKNEVAAYRNRVEKVRKVELEPLESVLADAEKGLANAEIAAADAKKVLDSLIV